MTEIKQTQIQIINTELTRELSDEKTKRALLATTFKGLSETSMKQACLEGMMRGFTFQNFLKRDVYAIPFKDGYSLITSIDYARKIGMRSGIVGKLPPIFEMDDKGIKVVSCTVTVKRMVNGYVGEFSASVYFSEYTKGRDLWISKPRTMLAKVAEMHALRMACPEELAQSYIEEEMHSEQSKFDGIVESSNLKMGNLSKANEKENKNQTNEDTTDSIEAEVIIQ